MSDEPSEWSLVDRSGTHYNLPKTTLFLGQKDCDITIKSRSIDERHAEIKFDAGAGQFQVKDLKSANGTYINDEKIAVDEYVQLNNMDTIRFGYDPMVYVIEKQDGAPAAQGQVLPPSDVWSARKLGQGMAECQGCIAEQGLHHVCGGGERPAAQMEPHNNPHLHSYHSGHSHDHMPNYATNRWQVVQSMDIHGPPPGTAQSVHHAVHMQMQPTVISHGMPMGMHEHPGSQVIRPISMHEPYMQKTGIQHDPHSGAAQGAVSYGIPHSQVVSTSTGAVMLSPTSQEARVFSPPADRQKLFSPPVDRQVYDVLDTYKNDDKSSVTSVSSSEAGAAHEVPVSSVDVSSGSATYRKEGPSVLSGQDYMQASVSAQSMGPSSNQDFSISGRAQVGAMYASQQEYAYDRQRMSQPSYIPPPMGISFAHKTADGKFILVNSSYSSPSETGQVMVSPREQYMAQYRGDYQPVSTHLASAQPAHETSSHNIQPPARLSYQPPAGVSTSQSVGEPVFQQTSPLDLKVKTVESTAWTVPEVVKNTSTVSGSSNVIANESVINVTKPNKASTENGDHVETGKEAQDSKSKSGVKDGEGPGTDSAGEGKKNKTPLYGQPSWWGEEDSNDGYSYPNTATLGGKEEHKSGVAEMKEQNEQKSTPEPSVKPQEGSNTEQYKSDRRYEHTYMEISFDDMNGDAVKPPLSEPRPGAHTPPTRDTDPGEETKSVSGHQSGTAFTVDLGGDSEKKPTRKSLSEFLPSKIRKSFRQRSAARNKDDDEDEMSPKQQRKADDTWDHSKSPGARRKSGYQSEGNKSLLSSEEEDISIRSDTYTTKAKKPPAASKSLTSTRSKPDLGSRTTSTKPPTRCKTPTRPKTPTSKTNTPTRPKTPKSGRDSSGKVSAGDNLRATKSTPYLIEKMFTADPSMSTYKDDMEDQATEFALYKEARAYSSQNVSNTKQMSVPRAQKSRGTPKRGKCQDNVDDDVSEAGTYTIEAAPSKAEQEARHSIDQVFGVENEDSDEDLDNPSPHMLDLVDVDPGTSLDVHAGSCVTPTPEEQGELRQVSHDGLTWVTQWASVVSNEENSSKTPSPKADEQLAGSKKTSRIARRLPTPPNRSPATPEELERKDSPSMEDDQAISDFFSTGRDSSKGRPPGSGRSLASLDTHVLLQDTDHVMNALGRKAPRRSMDSGRVSSDLKLSLAQDNDSDSEGDSTFAVINGSPQGALTRSKQFQKSQSLDNGSLPPKAVSAKELAARRSKNMSPREKVMRHMASRSGRAAGFQTEFEDFGHSDGNSDTEGYSESASYTSTDISEMGTKRNRPHSAKAAMSNTRTNRAFALRRARADGSEADSVKSVGSPRSPREGTARNRSSSLGRKQSRPSSGRESGRTDASLGAQIVKKSRENNVKDSSRAKSTSPFQREQSGRNSWRDKKSTPAGGARKLQEPKVNRGPSHSSGGLTITGQKSQPSAGGVSSNRSAEYSAWKRRKAYDPLRAVAEAKNKGKESKGKTESNLTRTQRSHSIGGTVAASTSLGHRPRSATNSSVSSISDDDFVYDDGADELNSSNRSEISKMSSALALNLDTLSRSLCEGDPRDVTEDAPFYNILSGLSERASAFSVPSVNNQTPSPTDSPPPVFTSHQLNMDLPSPQGKNADVDVFGAKDSLPEAYNSLLISSIYQLSLKLKAQTDRMLDQLRQEHEVSTSPSPVDEVLSQPDIPANPELASILKNLRKTEHKIKLMDKALFPQAKAKAAEASPRSTQHHQYLLELERIQKEIAGFKPISSSHGASKREWKTGSTSARGSSTQQNSLDGDEYY